MGLFKNMFGGSSPKESKEKKNLPWIALNSLDQLSEIAERSKSKTQLIFKHSTTCGVSRMVINMFTENYDFSEEDFDLYYLDLHAHREVSNETGYKFQVLHQSPQLLVIKKGVAEAHASHGAISEVDLNTYI